MNRSVLFACFLAMISTITNASAQDVYVPAEAADAKNELQSFLDRNPDASPLQSRVATPSPYKAFLTNGSVLSVFDGAGNLARRIPVEAAVPLPFEGLTIAAIPVRDGAENKEVRLLGFAAGKEAEFILSLVKAATGKTAQPSPWLEDADGDGVPEVCLYDDHALRCVRWNAADGKWEWIESLEGKLIERDAPPIRWNLRVNLDRENRIVRGKLRATNLTSKMLLLTRPPVPFFERVPPRRQKDHPSLTEVPSSGITLVSAGDWDVRIVDGGEEQWLDHGAEIEVAFEARPISAQLSIGDYFTLDVIGRARWRRFDAVFDLPLTTTFNDASLVNVDPGLLTVPDVIGGRVSQEELDRCVTALVANRRHVPPEFFEGVSDGIRFTIAKEALLGGGGYTILKDSVADDTTAAILKAIAETPDAAPVKIEQLLWLALMNLDPDEYAGALQKAGGAERLPAEALLRLLAYRGNLLDVEALARILAEWPDETVAARTGDVLKKHQEPGLAEP